MPTSVAVPWGRRPRLQAGLQTRFALACAWALHGSDADSKRQAWVPKGGERYTGFRSGEMNDELRDLRNAGYKPAVVGPQPFSFEDLLRNVDPAPDEETERFVADIYADRRQAAENSRPE